MHDDRDLILLTPDEMGAADHKAARSGIDSYGLMERAGQAIAAAALAHHPEARRFTVFCGPGNNGGDGYVAARALAESAAEVAVFALGDPARLKGDAATARAHWTGGVQPLGDWQPGEGEVIVDAVFGAGLARDVPEELQAVIATVTQRGLPVLAVDLPSGLDGRTGQVRGAAFDARHTVTFMTKKPGHLLLPGRMLCGALAVFDIGIPRRIISRCAGTLRENGPALWTLPDADAASHKFRRGHLGVFSGPATATGAARLSAMAGLKAGAGLVTLAARREALDILATHLTAIMLHEVNSPEEAAEWIVAKKLTAFVIGPGFGTGQTVRDYVELLAGHPLVLDADGISSFRGRPEALFSLFEDADAPTTVMTPHEGEFARLFPDLAAEKSLGKVEKALAAAARARAIVLYKGADTVIAAPDGRAVINTNAPPALATAGSGDVLAGIIGGLLAQGMPAYEAAAAGAWLHGEAGRRAGRGLTAEDLPEALGQVLAEMDRPSKTPQFP